MKLQNHLRLLGATALTVFAAACSDDAKQVTAADIATPRLDITNNGALGNFVWHDKNANGIQDDGEPGIPNAPLSFTGPTGSASGNATPTGTYLISGLPAGTYTVCAQLPSGYQYISPNAVGDDREVDSDGAGAQNCYTATLAQGEQRLDVDFGFYNPAELGDYVWYDKNSNGQQDADEVGIPNAMVTLAGPSGPLQAVTDANGKYKFTNLKPGTYEVCVAMPVGYTGVSPHSIGSDVTDSDGEGENNCTDTVLES
ncbi:MAG: SdrD B-like domain-containing protein, partial [Gemmatimonas sp.]